MRIKRDIGTIDIRRYMSMIGTYSELDSFGSSTVPGQLQKKIFVFPEWYSISII